ncbi:MAG: hypothetical protein AB1508_03885 [Pseudomonadota bacterium]
MAALPCMALAGFTEVASDKARIADVVCVWSGVARRKLETGPRVPEENPNSENLNNATH